MPHHRRPDLRCHRRGHQPSGPDTTDPPTSPISADRHPHCAWTITVEADAEPLPFPGDAERVADSEVARLPLVARPADLSDDDGANDYRGPMDPDLALSRFSSATLAAIADEVALQGHLRRGRSSCR